MSNRGFTAIEDVWEFLHAFVVEAARAGEDLGQGWKFQGRDVTGLVKELYDRNTGNSDYGRLNEWSVAWSLGIDHTVLKRIIKGWDNYHLGGSSKLSEWVLLGRKLRLAYHDALANPERACFTPWPVRPPTPAKVVKKLKRRISTIEEVWGFMHSFVVHAAQRGIDLEGYDDGTKDVAPLHRLFVVLIDIAKDEPKESRWFHQWGSYYQPIRLAQHHLGLHNYISLEKIVAGWDVEKLSGDEWMRLGWHLHDAYIDAQARPMEPFRPRPWPPERLQDTHEDWVYEGGSNLSYLTVPNPDDRKLYAIHSELEGTPYKWINGITGNSGEAPTVHAAKVAVEQDLVEHLRKMLAFMGAS